MQYDKLKEKNNPIFKRKELVLKMDYDGPTPSKAALQQMLAKDLKTAPNKVEISKIISFVGKDSGKIWVKVWEEKEIELYKEKNAPKEEAPVEQNKEEIAEAPKEEPKPEVKEETKAEEPEKKEGE